MRLFVILFALLLPLACANELVDPLEPEDPAFVDPLEPGSPAVAGSVQFLNLEGGCWTIEVRDQHYLPLNLPAEFRRDDLEITTEMRVRNDYGSTCMVGPVVEILSIRRR